MIKRLAVAIIASGACAAVQADKPNAPVDQSATTAETDTEKPATELSDEARELAEELDGTLPAGSEARAMYDDILKGSKLGPGSGWFRTAVGCTRFDWETLKDRFDRDGDEAISPSEFAGLADDFERLDRDRDGRVTEADLVWDKSALERDAAMLLFRSADRGMDGRIDAEDWSRLFAKIDRGNQGFVTIDDLRSALTEPADARREGPSVETLLRGLRDQEIGSLQPGPELNEPAPDFTLSTADGAQTVSLSQEIGRRPIVLVFGNMTCGPFRGQTGDVEKLMTRYQDRATFLMVYVREAHPTGGWRMESNDRVGVAIAQPTTYEQRATVATQCKSLVHSDLPFLVDTIDDRVGSVYSGMPSRLYVIDLEGRIAYKSGRGPFGFKPAEMEQSLIFLLSETSGASDTRP